MRFLAAFSDELAKLAAFPQQSGAGAPFDAMGARIMEQYQGKSAKTGLKTGQPVPTPPAPRPTSPTPLTTPNQMVASRPS